MTSDQTRSFSVKVSYVKHYIPFQIFFEYFFLVKLTKVKSKVNFRMVIPIAIHYMHEINFLSRHHLGPKMTIAEISVYLKIAEIDIETALNASNKYDFGGSQRELNFLQHHPLGPKYTVWNSVKVAVYVVLNFIELIILRICEQLPLIQGFLSAIVHYYGELADAVGDYMVDGSDSSINYSFDTSAYDISSDSFNESLNTTNETWLTADTSSFNSEHVNEITMWKREFMEIFPIPDIVDELYDHTMSAEKHSMNMVLTSLESHIPFDNCQFTVAPSVLLIRAQHYRDCFVKVFPVEINEFLLNTVYTMDLTLDHHIEMMQMAIRTKYAR